MPMLTVVRALPQTEYLQGFSKTVGCAGEVQLDLIKGN